MPYITDTEYSNIQRLIDKAINVLDLALASTEDFSKALHALSQAINQTK